MSFFSGLSRNRYGSGSGTGTSGSRYGTGGSSYGSSTGGYTGSSGYGGSGTYTPYSSTSAAGGGYGSSGASAGAGSTYSRAPSYGSGLSSYGSGGSTYGSSGYGSTYGTAGSTGYGSTASTGTTGYGSTASTGYGARDYGARTSARDYTTEPTGAGYGGYSSRTSRDRSSERSLDNVYGSRNDARRPSGGTGDSYSRSGLRKSSSYSGLHWMRDSAQDSPKSAVGDYKSHRRQDSSGSLSSDTVFEEGAVRGVSRSREGSLKKRDSKRDLEAILGREDHMLVQRIIEENKELIEGSSAKLSPQEERLVQKIMEANKRGASLDCLDILTIIESH